MAGRVSRAPMAAPKGALADLARLRFSDWKLTAAEADVALFALKGCDVAEIAALRGAARRLARSAPSSPASTPRPASARNRR